ncbi:MAG: hypothetical protein MUP44_09765 [Anaerolineales bacterium]|nr:hypothetical protein [Anaerolineales bacterium]
MKKISLEVIAPALTTHFHCMHCEQIFAQAGLGKHVHQEDLDQYPPEFKAEAERLADLLLGLVDRYGDRIRITVIDQQSLGGFVKSLRYWVRAYPTFIVNGGEVIRGWDPVALDAFLEQDLAGVSGNVYTER